MGAPVVVGSAGEDFFPSLVMGRRYAGARAENLDVAGGESAEYGLSRLAEELAIASVHSLKVAKKKNEFLEVECREHPIHAMEWMSYGVGDILGKQVFAKVEDVFSCLLDRAVLGFCDAPSENVDAAFVVREVGAYFLAEDDSWQMRDFEATGNGILIRDGHKIHPRPA